MTPEELFPTRLDERLTETLQDDIGSARLSEFVSETVPSRFPGQLLIAVARAGPNRVAADAALDAAIAVELTWLHQYLHTLPVAASESQQNVHPSYGDDATTAILDGDRLQSHAFVCLSSAIDDPGTTKRCYKLLASRSVEGYERSAQADNAPDPRSFAPIAGVAAVVGSLLSGAGEDPAVEQNARDIARSVPIQTPAGWVDRSASEDVTPAVERLIDAVAFSPADRERLRDLLCQFIEQGTLR